MIAPGFTPLSEVVESMRELAEDDEELGVDPDDAETLARDLWSARIVDLATPPGRLPTDDARVGMAFDALNRSGIVAWMNCGWDRGEASELCRDLARQAGARGYAYFHSQDAARLAHADAQLYIGFDAVPPAGEKFPSRAAFDAASVLIGQDVVAALTAQELQVRWDGTVESRVQVVDLDWRRPLPAG